MIPVVKNVLVIDDEQTVREYVRFSLEKIGGLCVFDVEGGEAGLQLLETVNIDLVMVDIVMPGKDGFEILRTCKTLRPHLRSIIMTGSANSDLYLDIAQRLGVNATLHKPFTRQNIEQAVEQAFKDTPC